MDLQEERGGAGVYNMDLRKKYLLADKKWNYDIMPEIYNGHNVADFVDPDIEERLEELEREEEAEAAEWEQQKAALGKAALGEEALTEPERATLSSIRLKKQRAVKVHRLKKNTARNYPVMPRTAGERGRTARKMRDSLGELGVDTAAAEERAKERAVRRGRSLTRKRVNRDGDTEMGEGEDGGSRGRSGSKRPKMMEKLHSSRSRSRSRSLAPERKRGSGLKNEEQRMKVQIMADKSQRKRNLDARKGEGDHHVPDWMPKHLYSGKRGNGKPDWR
jgi:nucleolar GTP-binding protein